MSIWSSRWTLSDAGHGQPWSESSYGAERFDGDIDLATATSWHDKIRVVIDGENNDQAAVVLDPDQARALHAALGGLIGSPEPG